MHAVKHLVYCIKIIVICNYEVSEANLHDCSMIFIVIKTLFTIKIIVTLEFTFENIFTRLFNDILHLKVLIQINEIYIV